MGLFLRRSRVGSGRGGSGVRGGAGGPGAVRCGAGLRRRERPADAVIAFVVDALMYGLLVGFVVAVFSS